MNNQILLKIAKIYADHYHSGQNYGSYPYIYHLDKVYHVLLRFGVTDEELLISAYLHDTVEDTDATVGEIREIFGDKIATIVDLISEAKTGTRKERHEYTYPRIASNNDAIKLKLADRIANMEESKKNDMYVKEYETFKRFLYKNGCDNTTQEMWNYLDNMIKVN
jgi:(p)ppGpp synthase/HD superfamily hydrolase